MNGSLRSIAEKMTFTAQAGLQIIDASRALREAEAAVHAEHRNRQHDARGRRLAATPRTRSTGSGSGRSIVVTAIKWVTPVGRAGGSVGGERSRAAAVLMRASYGCAGIVYEVTFGSSRWRSIQFSYDVPTPIKDLTDKEVDGDHHASNRHDLLDGRQEGTLPDAKSCRPSLGTFAWLFAAGRRTCGVTPKPVWPAFIDAASRPRRSGMRPRCWFAGSKLLMSTLHLVGGATLYNPDKTIDYSRTRPSAQYAFTFWAFPRSQWLDALRDYLEFSERHFEKHDFRCNMPLGSYFIRKDTQLDSVVHPRRRRLLDRPDSRLHATSRHGTDS